MAVTGEGALPRLGQGAALGFFCSEILAPQALSPQAPSGRKRSRLMMWR
jgi:hypothetical protein